MPEQRKYTIGEEIANALSHTIGVLFSIFAIVIMAASSKTAAQTATTAIFGATMFILFQCSVLYHALTNEAAKKVFQKIDHSAIYVLIAGTYTPILILTLPHPYSIAFLAVIWYLAIAGIVFSCISLKSKYIATGLYLIMGWMSVFLMYFIWTNGSQLTVYYLFAGGIVYSIGAILYLLKLKYMHCVWHLFVLGGVALHYLSILALLK